MRWIIATRDRSPLTTMIRGLKLEPWNITECRARSRTHHSGLYGASVEVLPIWPARVKSNCFTVKDQSGNGLAHHPEKLVLLIVFAFINLCVLGRERNSVGSERKLQIANARKSPFVLNSFVRNRIYLRRYCLFGPEPIRN